MSKVIKTISVLPNWTKNENKNPKDLRYKAVAEIQLLSNELGVSKNLSEFIQTFEILKTEEEIINYKKIILKGIVEDYLELVNGSKRRELWERKTEWEKIAILETLINNHKLFKGAWDLAGSSDIADILNEIYQNDEQREQIEETVESLETLKELEISKLKEKALKELNKNMTIPQTELNKNLVELKKQIIRLEKVIQENEEETKNLVDQLTCLAQEKEELSENLESEIILRQEKEAVIEEFEENKKLNEEKIAELELGKTTLENSLAQLNSKINTLQKRVNYLEERELAEALKEKKELEEIVEANRGEINNAKINAQKAIENQSTLINRHKEEIEEKNKEIERITEKSIEQLGELENVKAKLDRAKKTILELEKEVKNQKEQISKYVFTQSEHVEAQAENIKLEENLNKIAKDVDKISNQADLEEKINILREEKENLERTSEKYRIQVSSLKEQLKRWGIEDRDFDSKNSWWNKIAKVSEVEKWKGEYNRVEIESRKNEKENQEFNTLLLNIKSCLGIELGKLDNNNLEEKDKIIVGKIKNLQETATKLKIYREAIIEKFGSQENGEPMGDWQEKLMNLVTKEKTKIPTDEENLLTKNIKTLLGLRENDNLPNDWQNKLIRIDDLARELKIEKGREEEDFTFTIKNEKEEVFSFDEHWRSWKTFFLEPFIYKNHQITKLVIYQQQYTDELSLFVSNSEITLAVKKGLLNQLDENQPKEEIIDFQTDDDKEGSAKTLIIKNYVQRDDFLVNTWRIISSKKSEEVLTTNQQKGLNNNPSQNPEEVNQKLDKLNNEIVLQKTEIIKLKEQKKNAEKVNITLGILLFISIVGLAGILIRSKKKNSGIKRARG
jgi:hypothetical protein